MRQDEVTQDASFLEGHQKANYALDANGRYVVVASGGYEPERIATAVALQAQDRLVKSAWERARRGEASPLAYHLAVKQWTLGLAAAQIGIFRLRVWWHLKHTGFKNLSAKMRRRYCAGLDLDEAQLSTLPDAPERLGDEL